MKHKEIAAYLNKSPGTVRWIYSRAVSTLRIVLSNVAIFLIAMTCTVYRSGRAQSTSERILLIDLDFWLGVIMLCSLSMVIYMVVWKLRKNRANHN